MKKRRVLFVDYLSVFELSNYDKYKGALAYDRNHDEIIKINYDGCKILEAVLEVGQLTIDELKFKLGTRVQIDEFTKFVQEMLDKGILRYASE